MIARLRSAWREQGPAALAYRACAAVVSAVTFGRLRLVWYVLVAQPVRTDWRLPGRLGRSVALTRFDADDPVLHQAPRPDAILAARFAQGSVCFAAIRDGHLLGFLWLCPRRYVEDDVRAVFVLPPAGSAWWDYDVWIVPEARNGILFLRLWQAAHEWLAASGAQWTLSRITGANARSLAAHVRAGARSIGNLGFVCGRAWQLAFGVRPALLHFSRGPQSMPAIAVHAPLVSRSAEPQQEAHQCR